MRQISLKTLLVQPSLAGIYHLPRSGQRALENATAELDFSCFKVDLAESTDINTVLKILGRDLGFPEWYGANLDALNDCLTDFSWHEAQGYIILLYGADALHANPGQFNALNEVFINAIEAWRARNTPFWIFFDLRADGLATLPTLA